MRDDREQPKANELTDRELLEMLYRGIYGEPPVHPGLARRVRRLEFGYFILAALVLGVEGAKVLGVI